MATLSSLLVRIGVDDSRVGRAVRRTEQSFGRLGRSASQFGQQFGRSGFELGRSFSTNVANGLGKIGPGMAIKIAAGLSILPAIGAAAATGLVLAIGGAFAAIGLKAASANKGVQKEMSALKKHVSKTMTDISKPFVSTWHTILSTARGVFDKLAPELGKAFQHIAPALSGFVKQFGEGFKELAPSIEPLGKAFSALLTQIGPSLPGMFKGISEAITEIANTVAANPQLFAGFITGILKLIPIGFKLINWLAQAFVWVSKFMGTTNALVVVIGLLFTPLILLMGMFRKLKAVFEQAGISFSGTWNKAKAIFMSFVSFIGSAISSVKAKISAGVSAAKAVFVNGWNAMTSAARSAVGRLIGVARSIPGRIRGAIGGLGSLLFGAGRNVIQGLINGINSMVGAVAGAIGRVASTIRNHLPFSPAKEGPLSGRGNPQRSGMQIARMIAGGMLAGTKTVSSAAGAIAGAASVNSPSGVRAAGKNANAPLVINSGGSKMDDLLVEVLQSAIRNRGGSVQTVLGH